MLGQENVATPATDRSEYDDQNTDEPSSVITQLPHMHAVRSLRRDRARAKLGCYVATKHPFRSVATASVPLGRYVATELEPSSVATQRPSSSQARSLRSDRASVLLGRYVATELFRNVYMTLVHAFSSTLRCYLPKTVANPFHVSRHSKLSIKLYVRSLRNDRVAYVLDRYVATELWLELGRYIATELGLCVVRSPYSSLSVAGLDTCSLPWDNRNKICSAHILGSTSIDTNAISSIDSPSSRRWLPLARQTDHSSVKRA
ncbi:hypothetical protein DY000_02022518 [Brassica cretica]|uniref:Uncharacterized protein n=1 Tax=Brassica cretica TaxID=69181 RepID=A0ABQ7EHY0_BRACR|nr:hypothetical protein DY000_02022518 [Brassica cretica]